MVIHFHKPWKTSDITSQLLLWHEQKLFMSIHIQYMNTLTMSTTRLGSRPNIRNFLKGISLFRRGYHCI